MNQQKIDACVAQIGDLGCARIRELIHALQQGQRIPEVAGLAAPEREKVLQELLSIMVIYDRPGRKSKR